MLDEKILFEEFNKEGWYQFYSQDFWRHTSHKGNLDGCDTQYLLLIISKKKGFKRPIDYINNLIEKQHE